ncbi:helix-turn-helix transcriptional regulator [Leeia aquatica]|uniref:Transcriptional regulator n=1 Tax=Leeia aquatica TaxID=2725557 RepID=A0A847SDF8_9NEIS|nr:metalloregulator ArsR/SmtB family transcription factor [Leeia aquatica]NLR75208.1 transcriptional regulator [Leeia aquatica]
MSSAEQILYLLKTRGAQTAQTLADALDLTPMGARKHLLALEAKGLLQSEERAEGVGRPGRYWMLTDAGHARFPDRHSDLTLQLIDQVRSLFGEAGLDQLIAAREQQARQHYQAALASQADLASKVTTLARLRSEEGYMAEAQRDEDGHWLLLENHCPICAAARQCQGFCRAELTLFQHSLGPAFKVERSEHLLAGARRCTYRIQWLKPT